MDDKAGLFMNGFGPIFDFDKDDPAPNKDGKPYVARLRLRNRKANKRARKQRKANR